MDNTRRAPDMVYRKLDLTRVDDIELLALLGGRDARTRTSVGIAYYNLGMYREALPYLREAAGGGSLLALEYLAEMNYYGQGMPEDRAEAFRIDTEAAERGSLYAMYSLGVMYLRGVATEQDLAALALDLARRHPGFFRLAGSDTHQAGDEARAGVILPEKPADSFAYKALIEQRRFRLWSPEFQSFVDADEEMRKEEAK